MSDILQKSFIRIFFLIIFSFFTSAYADSEPGNNWCSSGGELISELNGITDSKSRNESGSVYYSADQWDVYSFTPQTGGQLDVAITSSRPDYSIYVGKSCGTYVVAGTNNEYDKDLAALSVNPGETIYIYIQARTYLKVNYTLKIKFTKDLLATNNPRPFTKVNVAGEASTNIYGDLLVIGNQSLCWKNNTSSCQNPPFTASNNSYLQQHARQDPSATTLGYANSTSANLTLNPNDRVVEAWLYWIGRLYNEDDKRTTANTIRLKTPSTGNYVTITSDPAKFNWMTADTFDYAGAANVTEYVKQSGTYWVADLKATEMTNQGSGWALAVIVEDTGSNKIRTLKNISLYDGFNGVYNAAPYPATVSSDITGFYTSRSGTVKSNLIVFAGESDRQLGDSMSVAKKDGTLVAIKDSLNDTNNVQNGTVSRNGVNVTTRSPNFANTLGIDIDEIDVSDIMENEQTSTVIKIDSKDDRIFLSMYGFATELYIPQLCYDFNVRKNGYTLSVGDNRDIITVGDGELAINASVRSMEGDFDLETSKLKMRATPTSALSFLGAQYSPNTINTLIPAIFTVNSSSTAPEIAIGMNATPLGGAIGTYERYFSEFKYKLNNSTFNGHFELDLNTSIDFGSGPVNILLSTENNTLPRCPQSPMYQPQWGAFNIERTDSATYNAITQPGDRFSLFTQIVGRDYDFSVVAYDANSSPAYSQEMSVANTTVDVELIDASPYDDNGSYFKCSNTDQSIIQTLPNGDTSFFVYFPPTGAKRVDLAENDDIITDTALKNAAFRMWILVDQNDTIVKHQCTDKNDDACFETVYTNFLKSNDTEGYCANCSSYTGGCYACLRDHFAKPICSRDNFSIRPASYRINISDNNESNVSGSNGVLLGKNDIATNLLLAAEYKYKIDANATRYNSDNFAKQYNRNFYTPSNDDLLSQFEYQTSSGSNCADTTNADVGILFEDGKIAGTFDGTKADLNSNNLQSHSNVGDYLYHIEDNNWTIVDQKRYPYKTFPNTDDCTPNNYDISLNGNLKSGCGISSNISYNGFTYTDIGLTFRPYLYDVSNIVMSLPNDTGILYTNNLNTPNITERAMAVRYNGEIAAKGKLGTTLSNYTENCAAKDVIFDIHRNISRNGIAINENNIYAMDPCNVVPTSTKITLQRYNSSSEVNETLAFSSENNETNTTTSIVITSLQFNDEDNGTANLNLEYNFNRPCPEVTNPLDVNFTLKEANSTLAKSSAHLNSNYIPRGTEVINDNAKFIYGRIAPSSQDKYIVPKTETVTTIPLYVEAFCAGTNPDDSTINCAEYALSLSSLRDSNTWWINAAHNSSKDDGDIATIKDKNSPSPLSISPNTDVPLTNPSNITVSINPAAHRPYVTEIVITPSVPWLVPCSGACYGDLNPTVYFKGGGGWAGKGNTGLVVDTEAGSDETNKRTDW